MTVNIGFRLAGPSDRYFIEPTSVSVNADNLRYALFVGDVEMVVGDCNLGTEWGWVPILDFAASLAWVLGDLKRSGVSRFEFTESNAVIDFRVEGDTVYVSPSYVECAGTCSFRDFAKAVAGFVRRVLAAIRSAAPSVAQADRFLELERQMLTQIENA